jgi:hypothetical protein
MLEVGATGTNQATHQPSFGRNAKKKKKELPLLDNVFFPPKQAHDTYYNI